MDYILS